MAGLITILIGGFAMFVGIFGANPEGAVVVLLYLILVEVTE